MYEKKFKYEFTQGQANYVLTALDSLPVTGVQNMQNHLGVVSLFQSPSNKDELDKAQYEEFKAKFEPKKDKK